MERLKISFFEGLVDKEPETLELDWSQLCSLLTKHERRPTKEGEISAKRPLGDGLLWTACGFAEGDTRRDVSAQPVNVACFDVDNMSPENFGAALARIDAARVACIIYSTHRYTPQNCKVRIVFRVSRPIQASEWRGVRAAIAARFGLEADESTKNVSRMYFLPSAPEGAEVIAEVCEGEAIDVDALGIERTPERQAVSAPSEPVAIEPTTDLAEHFKSAQRMRDPARKELLLSFLEGRFTPEDGSRDVTLHLLMSLLAATGKAPLAPETVTAMLRPVIARMVTEPEGAEYWHNKAMFSYERGYERRIAKETALQATRKAFQRLAGNLENFEASPKPEEPAVPNEDEDWHLQLITKTDKEGDVVGFESIGANVDLILQHDAGFKDALRFNLLKKSIEVTSGLLKGAPEQTLDVALANWLARSPYALKMQRAECSAQILHTAMLHPYDPVREYLMGLSWDGVERISRALHTYGKAGGNDGYIEQISRKFFVSAVARALLPGCKVDTMLILHGDQGIGKSRFVKALGDPWTTSTRLDVANKDSILVVTGNWLVELAELAAMKRSDSESVKAFLSTQSDQVRLPYAKAVQDFPRRSIFIGTTNDPTPLTDPSGSRRFWPVSLNGPVDFEALVHDRDQLWAEARVAFEAGEQWFLTGAEKSMADDEATIFEKEDTMVDIVFSWYIHKNPRPPFVAIKDVAKHAFQVMPDGMTDTFTRRIGEVLRRLKFERKRIKRDNVLQYVYYAPQNLLNAQLIEETPRAARPPIP